MSKKKKSPIILITGTRKGIGREFVEYFIQKNFIVIGCSRNKINFNYDNYYHYSLDISNEKDVKIMFLELRKRFKRLDILINNAGLASMNHTLLTPGNKVQEIFNTNFTGSFLLSRESAKLMKLNNYGRIINITSVGTQMKLEGEAIYTASKAALENLTISMSRELSNFGITVNAIGPTPYLSDLIRTVPNEKINNITDNLAFKRLTEFRDISNVTEFFISPDSDFITGQIIFLGGG